MRSISPAGLAKLQTKLGVEPIVLVEIDWVPGSTSAYADRTVASIPGKIVELSEFDDVTSASGHSSNQQVTVTLDDVDGTIKTLLDAHDVHKRPARVYQYFSGLDLSDRFKLFSGIVSTPIVWSERDRTVKVTILSELEVTEVDSSIEDSMSGTVSESLRGKNFPMIFGTVENAPTVQYQSPATGTLLQPVGVLDGAELYLKYPVGDSSEFDVSLAKGNYQLQYLSYVISICESAYEGAVNAGQTSAAAEYWKAVVNYQSQYASLQQQLIDRVTEKAIADACTLARRKHQIEEAQSLGYGENPVQILGGEDFPQGPVTVAIGDAYFTGTMSGNRLTIDSRSSAYLSDLASGAYNSKLGSSDPDSPNYDPCIVNQYIQQYWQWSEARIPVQTVQPDGSAVWDGQTWENYVWPSSPMMYKYVPNLSAFNNEAILQHLWCPAGSSVRLIGDNSLRYLVSATPGTVTAVRAMKNVSGVSILTDVPADYYTVSVEQFGTTSATVVTLTESLTSIPLEGWTDELYVTFQSTVGPNVADILRYLVETYTLQTCDATFDAVKQHLSSANFVVSDFQDILSLIRNIAYQANCEVYIEDGVVSLKYLPLRPASVDTITESDIDAEAGIEVELTGTEELITKMTINWSTLPVVRDEHVSGRVWAGTQYIDKLTWGLDPAAIREPKYSMVLRNNIAAYGTFAETFNYYIFKDSATVKKYAAFWMNRRSHTWKRVRFTTPLHKLNIESSDAITLAFSEPYLASTPILALVESAKYDSANNCIHFQCLTPVKAGTLVEDSSFWPG